MTESNPEVRMTAYVLPKGIMAIILNEAKESKRLNIAYDIAPWLTGKDFTISQFNEQGKLIKNKIVKTSGHIKTEKMKPLEMEVIEFIK
jgi:hypothetical protein